MRPYFPKNVKKLGYNKLCKKEQTVGITLPKNLSLVILKARPLLRHVQTLNELKREIKQYLIYYNYYGWSYLCQLDSKRFGVCLFIKQP
ncbi:hypothetical protein BK729_13100 [Bacillus thuringiensis serovar wratislaviensis]|nr:hypothetical protein BK729_13100 [Bacillus thuringiensis serovar wratislaviensis]OUB59104.1 hypothetical protein BK743_13005 [Bacillus thuringiensis serovar sylvestriensis]